MNRTYLLVILPSLLAFSLRGDTIELKTGERIDGVFKQATAAGAEQRFQELGGEVIPKKVTNSSSVYRDYSQRVLDTKVKVDRYLAPGQRQHQPRMRLAAGAGSKGGISP